MSAYRVSRYNYYMHRAESDEYLVYNSVSNGLAKFKPEVYAALHNGDRALRELDTLTLEELCSGHFIVDHDLDEIEFMRLKLNLTRFNSQILHLTIAPTLGCNLNCAYCYEALRAGSSMDDSTVDAVAAFAKSQVALHGYRRLSVTWYGGEPLLAPKIVFSLSKKLLKLCRDKKLEYSAMMVTNGTRLNKKIVRRLRSYQINMLQVTIDGPKEIHDQRRPFKAARNGSSFEAIVSGVDRVLGIMPVTVRINVDKTNYSRSLEFVEQMRAKGWQDKGKNCQFYIGFTRAWTSACSNIADQCFSMGEYVEAEFVFQKELLSQGMSLGTMYPGRSTYCAAASPNGFVIGPKGELWKCWADVNKPEASFGNVREPIELKPKLLEWLTYDALTQFPECRSCTFFPVCAGGCPEVAIRHGNHDGSNCVSWKLMMDRKIDVYLQALAGKPKEENNSEPLAAVRV